MSVYFKQGGFPRSKVAFTHLEITDRATGNSELMSLENKAVCDVNVDVAADFNSLSLEEGWEILRNGGELVTFRFIQRLV